MIEERPRRVLWLLNHTTLRNFEVPLLQELGFEVFTPKYFPGTPENGSASVDYKWDDSLTISKKNLDTLNNYDFYGNIFNIRDKFSIEIRSIINNNFDIAICAYMFPMLDNLITCFNGKIIIRAFGLTSEDWNYFNYAIKIGGTGFLRRISAIEDRVFFGPAYENLKEIEPPFFQQRSIYLPLGLSQAVMSREGAWVGGRRQVLFVCPNIEVFEESKAIYKNFKRHFGDLPHLIAGSQSKPVDSDPRVTGRLSAGDYDAAYEQSAVMFYHSRLSRHLHFHPLEAIAYGMPLIFMKQGMLGHLGGANLPGASETFGEARMKVMRLLNGDEKFSRIVRETQTVLLEKFRKDYCFKIWRKALEGGIFDRPISSRSEKKIAYIVLHGIDDGALEALCALIRKLKRENIDKRYFYDYTLCVPLREYQLEQLRHKFSDIKIRSYSDKLINSSDVLRAQELAGVRKHPFSLEQCICNDGMSKLMDFDMWIVSANAGTPYPIAPLKPYLLIFAQQLPLLADVSKALIGNADGVVSPSKLLLSSLERMADMRPGDWLDIGEWQRLDRDSGADQAEITLLVDSLGESLDDDTLEVLAIVLSNSPTVLSVRIVSSEPGFRTDVGTLQPKDDSPSAIRRAYRYLSGRVPHAKLRFIDDVTLREWAQSVRGQRLIWAVGTVGGYADYVQAAIRCGVPVYHNVENPSAEICVWGDDPDVAVAKPLSLATAAGKADAKALIALCSLQTGVWARFVNAKKLHNIIADLV